MNPQNRSTEPQNRVNDIDLSSATIPQSFQNIEPGNILELYQIANLDMYFRQRESNLHANASFPTDNIADLKKIDFTALSLSIQDSITSLDLGKLLVEIGKSSPATSIIIAHHWGVSKLLNQSFKRNPTNHSLEQVINNIREGHLVCSPNGEKVKNSFLQPQVNAQKVDGGYILNGEKSFASGSIGSKYAVVAAKYKKNTEEILRISLTVDLDNDTISQDPTCSIDMLRPAQNGTITFQNTFVPDDLVSISGKWGEWNIGNFAAASHLIPFLCSAYGGISSYLASSSETYLSAEKVNEILDENNKIHENLEQMLSRVNYYDSELSGSHQSFEFWKNEFVDIQKSKLHICKSLKLIKNSLINNKDDILNYSELATLLTDLDALQYMFLPSKTAEAFIRDHTRVTL